MNVNTAYRFLLLVLAALASFPATAQNWTFDVPEGWTVEWKPDDKNKLLPMDAIFASSKDRLEGKLVVRRGAKVSGMSAGDFNAIVPVMAEDLLPLSREGQLNLRPFGSGNGGQYARLTLKDSTEPFMFATFAVFRRDQDLMIGVLSSNDAEAALLPKFLKLFESIVVGETPAARPAVVPAAPVQDSSAKGQKPAAPDIAWGAIATDATIGETDPYYGIGGGDTQVEAEKNALKFCRKEGAKRCVLRLTYTQCGAYALSEVGSGTGLGATKREAERLALSACKGRDCEIVASDCN
jgi:hypothetical protein